MAPLVPTQAPYRPSFHRVCLRVCAILLALSMMVGLAWISPVWALMLGLMGLASIGFFVGLRHQVKSAHHQDVQEEWAPVNAKAFGSLNEARALGWQFLEPWARVYDQEIPRWAILDNQWFEFDGLSRQATSEASHRWFGILRYRRQECPDQACYQALRGSSLTPLPPQTGVAQPVTGHGLDTKIDPTKDPTKDRASHQTRYVVNRRRAADGGSD